jgi:hypothetical protein
MYPQLLESIVESGRPEQVALLESHFLSTIESKTDSGSDGPGSLAAFLKKLRSDPGDGDRNRFLADRISDMLLALPECVVCLEDKPNRVFQVVR